MYFACRNLGEAFRRIALAEFGGRGLLTLPISPTLVLEPCRICGALASSSRGIGRVPAFRGPLGFS